jgi:hypothetical protein
VETIRATLVAVSDDMPMMDAIRRAVVAANHYRTERPSPARRRGSNDGGHIRQPAEAGTQYSIVDSSMRKG